MRSGVVFHSLDTNRLARANARKGLCVSLQLPQDVDRAVRRLAEEEAQGFARRPVRDGAGRHVGLRLLLARIDRGREVDFIAPETGLSSGNTNTWIGDNAENVLLAACLYEASAFLKAAETLALYKTQFDEAVQLFVQEMQRDYAAEYNGGL